MSPRTVERVDDWTSVPFDGGYGGLRDLASQEFSGVVTTGPTRLFMIRGTVVGVLDGSIDDFEGSSGSAGEAPHSALPLLAVMQERTDEVRAKYYTEDTPIADVDRTLSDGSFTGYVELAENVLSGDYYQVYHQGRSMSVAFVGSSQRLITDDEAFDQANGEVGIFEVRPVPIEAIDIPEPADDDTGTVAGAGADASAATTDEPAGESTPGEDVSASSTDESSRSDEEPVEIPSASSDRDPVESRSANAETTEADAAEANAGESTASSERAESEKSSASGSDRTSQTPTDEGSTAEPSGVPEFSDTTSSDDGPDDTHPAAPSSTESSARQEGSTTESSSGQQSSRSHPSTDTEQPSQRSATPDRSQQTTQRDEARSEQSRPASGQSTDAAAGSGAASQRSGGSPSPDSAADLETRSIPSLDPGRTKAASKTRAKQKTASRSGEASQRSQSQHSQQSQRSQQPRQASSQSREESSGQSTPPQGSEGSSQHPAKSGTETSTQSSPEGKAGGGGSTQESSASDGTVAELAGKLEDREQQIEDLQTDIERVEAERDELETELTGLETERDRLESELEESRAEIDRLNERLEDFAEDAAGTAGTQLNPGEAIDNTNLFVRYNSKGDATLETAHAGDADRSAVADNMRVEYHTQFDADDASVGDESFDDFLTGTIQYRFVDWLVSSLLYEVRDTGHADAMADLYNALPKIDRAELNGQVTVNYSEDGEEHRSQERFDVVVRDRMGNALVVANINDSRDPATDAMMTDLVKRAERVGASGDSLAGSFLVTESFFEPEALETANESTSSGLFSRDKRKSFVNLSRKGGFHLCLVEARNNEFHLAVPEL